MAGETLAEIASEKAGIIKPDAPVVTGGGRAGGAGVIEAKARSMAHRSHTLRQITRRG